MQIEENIPLSPYTTFQIGGPGRFFVRVQTIEELKEALAFAREKNLPLFILGGGSNVLVDDQGWEGLVIKIEFKGIAFDEGNRDTTLVVAAGEKWDDVVARAVAENLWGLENLSGIPGSVGAAPVQNIGAYGAQLSDVFLWAEIFDIETEKIKKVFADECGFGYRTSTFKQNSGKYIIVRVAFCLPHGSVPNLSYRDLADLFDDKKNCALADIRQAVLQIRADKFPDLAQEGTAGSFFLNPVVPAQKAEEIRSLLPQVPQFSTAGGVKIPLAYLLDKGLNLKGLKVGRARLFERQPLVIVVEKGTSSREVYFLAEEVKKKVFDSYAIEIGPEVQIIGEKK